MKKVFSLLLALATLLCCFSACAEGTFRVGMECNYAPFNWTQTEASDTAVAIEGGLGYADGYDVQIAKKLAEGLGKELVIVKTEWDGLAQGVVSGLFDAIIAGMSPTAERKATIDFSDPYYKSEIVIVVRKDGAYAAATTLADFNGSALTGQLNTLHYNFIDQIEGANKLPAMETFPAMIVALQSGAIDGYIAERPGAVADTTANPDLCFVQFAEGSGFVTSDEEVSIAVGLPKNSELLAPINEILATIDADMRNQLMLDATARQPLLNVQ